MQFLTRQQSRRETGDYSGRGPLACDLPPVLSKTNQELQMMKSLTITAVAIAGLLAATPCFALSSVAKKQPTQSVWSQSLSLAGAGAAKQKTQGAPAGFTPQKR
jgi:hypothetical protein